MQTSELVNRIANGEATLLGINEICKRLNISRTTFDRWVKNSTSQSPKCAKNTRKFPLPDIRIGNSPKWELATFKQWIVESAQ